jgi:hypothetical protein
MAEVPGLVAKMAAAGDDPDAVAALQNALQGLGAAYVEFGKAILAIDVKKAAGGADGSGKKKKVDPCAVPVRLPTPRTFGTPPPGSSRAGPPLPGVPLFFLHWPGEMRGCLL